jgi:hypothetical protein
MTDRAGTDKPSGEFQRGRKVGVLDMFDQVEQIAADASFVVKP